jgi:predicted acylesterase/phospholipase RssA
MLLDAVQYVVLGGGAMHGLMYLGVLAAVFKGQRDAFFAWRANVLQFAGASMGALLAVFLTVWTPWDVWAYTKTAAFQFIARGMFDQSWSAVASSQSISSGAALDAGLQAGLADVFGTAELTLQGLYARTGKCVVIVVTNLDTGRAEYWSHVTRPSMPLWLALRASVSLPGVFPAVRIGPHLFCDGGVTCNVPCHLTPPARTLTLLVHTPMRTAAWGVLPRVWDSLMGASQLGCLRAQPLYTAGLIACAACATTPSAYNFDADAAAIDAIVLQGMRAWVATLARAALILVALRETFGEVADGVARCRHSKTLRTVATPLSQSLKLKTVSQSTAVELLQCTPVLESMTPELSPVLSAELRRERMDETAHCASVSTPSSQSSLSAHESVRSSVLRVQTGDTGPATPRDTFGKAWCQRDVTLFDRDAAEDEDMLETTLPHSPSGLCMMSATGDGSGVDANVLLVHTSSSLLLPLLGTG